MGILNGWDSQRMWFSTDGILNECDSQRMWNYSGRWYEVAEA